MPYKDPTSEAARSSQKRPPKSNAERNREWYKRNRVEQIARTKRYQATHKKERDEYVKKYRKNNREKIISKLYKMPVGEWTRMLINQQGLCNICLVQLKKVHVDHCHVSGRVRGLLCVSCNNGLARFRDSVEILNAAIRYLSV
jgi:hypothetical protein